MDHALVDLADLLEVPPELAHEPVHRWFAKRAGARHAAGYQFQSGLVFGQSVRLQIVLKLETMFQMAEELIRKCQPPIFRARKVSLVLKARKRQ